MIVGILLWRASLYMIYRVINRTLQRRLRTFLGLFVSGVHFHMLLKCPFQLQASTVEAAPLCCKYCRLVSPCRTHLRKGSSMLLESAAFGERDIGKRVPHKSKLPTPCLQSDKGLNDRVIDISITANH